MSQTEVQLIKDAVIVNADVSNSAAIDVSKISGAMPLAGGTFTGDILFQSDSGNILFDKSDNALEFSDSNKAKFGGSGDLEIFHDGSNSYLKAVSGGTGSLYIFADGKNIFLRPKSGEDGVKVIPDGAVELYHNGTKEFETTSNGIKVLSDNAIVDLVSSAGGTSTSFIQFRGYRTVGDIGRLGEMQFINQRDGDVQAEIEVIANGDTNSYFDFKTSNAGLRTLRVDHSGANFPDNIKARFGASEDLQIFHTGSHSEIADSGTGDLRILTSKLKVLNNPASADELMIQATENGAVELYHNNVKRLDTTSTGNVSTGVHKFITGSGSTASDDNVVHIVAGGTADRGIMIGTGRGGGVSQNDGMGFIDAINSVSHGYGSQLQFRVDGTAVMSIGHQSNDFVGIGTVTPSAMLNIGGLTNTAGGSANAFKITRTDGVQLFGIDWAVNSNEVSFPGNTKNYVFKNGSSSAETVRFPSTGGITFNGDTATANALDDYEEGNWTPAIRAGGGSLGTIHNAKYTKIGRVVHVQAYMNYTAGSSGSAFQIEGLPFTVAANHYAAQAADFQRVLHKGVYSRTHSSNDFLEFLYAGESTSSDRITLKGNQIGTGYIIFATTYMT